MLQSRDKIDGRADVAEWADARDLKSRAFGHVGSSPTVGTKTGSSPPRQFSAICGREHSLKLSRSADRVTHRSRRIEGSVPAFLHREDRYSLHGHRISGDRRESYGNKTSHPRTAGRTRMLVRATYQSQLSVAIEIQPLYTARSSLLSVVHLSGGL